MTWRFDPQAVDLVWVTGPEQIQTDGIADFGDESTSDIVVDTGDRTNDSSILDQGQRILDGNI